MRNRVGFLDDDTNLLEALSDVSGHYNCEPVTTVSHKDLVEWARNGLIDTAVVDIRMPSINGTEVLEMVHQQAPKVRLVVLTGFKPSDEEDRRIKLLHARHFIKTQLRHLLHYLNSVDGLSESIDKQIDADSQTELLIDSREKIERLLDLTRGLIVDLLDDLKLINDKDSVVIGENSFSIAELISDLENQTPRGVYYMNLWKSAKSRIKQHQQK